MKKNNYQFPYLGFVLDEEGIEHVFGKVLPDGENIRKLDDYRHAVALKNKIIELYPDLVLTSDGEYNLGYLVGELASYNIITYLNLSGEAKVTDGSLQVGLCPTLKQRAALREYNNFFTQHSNFPIHYYDDEINYETYYTDIEEFLDSLYEEEYFRR